jgi:hypothetical protein
VAAQKQPRGGKGAMSLQGELLEVAKGEIRALTERVAALEEMAAYPLRSVTGLEFTDEQAREFEERVRALGLSQHDIKILPSGPRLLTQDEVRQLLRECVTVVKPGELLVIRIPDLTPEQLYEYNEVVKRWLGDHAPGVRCLVTIGEELGVAKAPGARGHVHPPGDMPQMAGLFAHLANAHGLTMAGSGYITMGDTHDALHGHQRVASGAGGHE